MAYWLIALLFFAPTFPGHAPEGESDMYLVTVTRTEDNIYRLDSSCSETGCLFARTRFCDEYPVNQKAVIEYSERWDVDNILFLGSNETCDVVDVG